MIANVPAEVEGEKSFTADERRQIRAARKFCHDSFRNMDKRGEKLAGQLGLDPAWLADDFGADATSPSEDNFFRMLAKERMLNKICALAHDSGLSDAAICEVFEQFKDMNENCDCSL